MNELMIFNNPEFGAVRTVEIDGEPWLVGKDVAAALGYSDTDKAIRNHVDDDDKLTRQFGGSGQNRNMTVINESGLYALVLSSKLPGAKKFRRWVTAEVLPAIRRTGSYGTGALSDSSKATLAEAKAKNARARIASMWLKLAKENPIPEYKAICAHYASAELNGGMAVLPLPEVIERTYSAAEVGEMLGGVSANAIGRAANRNGLKTPEYGKEVWDKSPHSSKQVQSWRYNDKAVARLREIFGNVVAFCMTEK